ncbi:MAG: hypothetical protein VXX38_05315 [Candidatus Neomarinimicrobiota bacterium]|jgi:hypothetical protein|nr:hypothetical protein [Candidatus Neomarinimicrobiota bacterium]|tara:strand:+ start:11 stop:454 length:444 start_codon:yes stop_codon:yes gene_type:complete
MNKLWILFFCSSLYGQVIEWDEKREPITAIQIFCDTEGIPIFVDGIQVGASPIKEAVQVAPGWHQVSYFPPNMNINTGSMSQNRKMRDLIQIARQDVLVEEGKTVRVVLSYRSLEGEALEYEQRLSSSRWVGLSMVFVLIGLMTWAM